MHDTASAGDSFCLAALENFGDTGNRLEHQTNARALSQAVIGERAALARNTTEVFERLLDFVSDTLHAQEERRANFFYVVLSLINRLSKRERALLTNRHLIETVILPAARQTGLTLHEDVQSAIADSLLESRDRERDFRIRGSRFFRQIEQRLQRTLQRAFEETRGVQYREVYRARNEALVSGALAGIQATGDQKSALRQLLRDSGGDDLSNAIRSIRSGDLPATAQIQSGDRHFQLFPVRVTSSNRVILLREASPSGVTIHLAGTSGMVGRDAALIPPNGISEGQTILPARGVFGSNFERLPQNVRGHFYNWILATLVSGAATAPVTIARTNHSQPELRGNLDGYHHSDLRSPESASRGDYRIAWRITPDGEVEVPFVGTHDELTNFGRNRP